MNLNFYKKKIKGLQKERDSLKAQLAEGAGGTTDTELEVKIGELTAENVGLRDKLSDLEEAKKAHTKEKKVQRLANEKELKALKAALTKAEKANTALKKKVEKSKKK